MIDRDHQAFLELITAMRASDNVAFPTLFRSMHAHIAEHFEHEDALMTEYACPTAREHRAEHERVLGECRQFAQRVERGFVEFGRAFVMERLMPWFDVHIHGQRAGRAHRGPYGAPFVTVTVIAIEPTRLVGSGYGYVA